MRTNERFSLLLADNLNNQIFRKFVLPTIQHFGKIKLREEAQYSLLNTIVDTTIYGFDVESVTLYSHDKMMVFSTKYSLDEMIDFSSQPEVLGIKADAAPDLESALAGVHKTRIISNADILQLYLEPDSKRVKMKTMAPFRTDLKIETRTEPVMGALEIVLDVSDEMREIWKQQILTIGTSLVIMLFLFLTLLGIVRRAELIINRRQQEKERLEQQLNQAERLAGLGRMVAGVSHEIRNPLGIISSTAEILAQQIVKYEPKNRLADIILEESQRMNRIVTEFLDFARPQAPKRDPIQLQDVVERNLSYLAPQFERRNITVEKFFTPHLQPVMADSDLLYRGFLNIFNNAIQAMPEGGKLRVAIENGREKGRRVQRIIVDDTGCGIPEEAKINLFTPFYTTNEKGTGLGLAIVKNIIEGHGGRIEINSPTQSNRDGRSCGTSVTIILGVDSHVNPSIKG